jgi:hypothetical protein
MNHVMGFTCITYYSALILAFRGCAPTLGTSEPCIGLVHPFILSCYTVIIPAWVHGLNVDPHEPYFGLATPLSLNVRSCFYLIFHLAAVYVCGSPKLNFALCMYLYSTL